MVLITWLVASRSEEVRGVRDADARAGGGCDEAFVENTFFEGLPTAWARGEISVQVMSYERWATGYEMGHRSTWGASSMWRSRSEASEESSSKCENFACLLGG